MTGKSLILILIGVLALGWTTLFAADEAPATQPSAVRHVEPYIGQWHIAAKWSDGNPLDARASYEWGLNKKFVVAKTFVKQPDGSEYQRYETIFGDEDGKLVMYSFDFTGAAHVRPMTIDGKKLNSAWTVPGTDGPVNLKQTVELTDDQHFHWYVATQDKDGKWQTMMDGVWERTGTADAR